MLLSGFELLVGIVLVLMTLWDVFDTVIVPGGSRASLQVAHRLVQLLLPFWRWLRPQRGISPMFAPVLLVAAFGVWSALLLLGFGLIADGAGDSFHPQIHSLSAAMYLAGSSMVTLGLTGTEPAAGARWIVLAAGYCGFASISMAVAYLLMVQSSVSKRDVGVFKLNTAAGDPPSGVALLENYAVLGSRSELPYVLRESRNWCTAVLQSHSAHPSLIYFRSIGTGAGWPAALGAMLDLSMIATRLLERQDWSGAAALLRADGRRMAEQLGRQARLTPALDEISEAELAGVQERLVAAGYKLRPDIDVAGTLRERAANMAFVKAMADHLGKPSAPFLPKPGVSL